MRILRLQLSLPPCPGGMELHVRYLTDEQRAMGHTVTLAYNRGAGTHQDDVRLFGCFDLATIRPEALRSLVFTAAALWRFGRGGRRYDVLHVHGAWSLVLAARLLAWAIGAPALVASAHASLRQGRLRTPLHRVAFAAARLVCVTGKADADMLAAASLRAVHWQASGVRGEFLTDTPPKREASGPVVTVANLLPVKNLDLVIAIARLRPQRTFWLIGDGPERERLERAISNAACRNVELLGRLTFAQVKDRLDRAAVFLCTSRSEGTPTAMLEAMARGLPIITSACNDFGPLLRGRCGFTVPGDDPEAYAHCLDAIERSSGRYARMSRRARQVGANHGWPAVAKRITHWTGEAIAQARR